MKAFYALVKMKFPAVKAACVLLVCGVFATTAQGQTYTIGTGTLNSTTGVTPFQCLYEDNRSQYLYLASELTAAGASAGSVLSLAINITAVGTPNPKNVNIKMGTQAGATLGTSFVASLPVYYSSTEVNIAATGWYTFTLSTPFTWNGTSNIIVEFCRDHDTGDWDTNYGVQSTQFGAGVFRNYTQYDDAMAGCSMTTGANASTAAQRRTRPNLRFTFGTPPTCFAPTGLTTTSVSATSANLQWTASVPAPSNGYQWEVRTSGAAGSGLTGLAASGNTGAGVVTATASGLSAQTPYSYYVRGYCGGSDYSSWTAAYNFTTPCATTAIPLSEGLNSISPSCWTSTVVTNGNADFTGQAPAFYYETTSSFPAGLTPQEGSGFFAFNSFDCDTGDQIRLVSAPLSSTGVVSVDVLFKWALDDEYTNNDNVQVQYSLNGTSWTNVGSAISRYSATATVPTWQQQTITLPGAAGNQALLYVGFLFTSAYGNDCHIDDIIIQSSPTCVQPTALVAGVLTPTTAPFSWTASVSLPANGYQWEARSSGAAGSGPVGLEDSGSVGAGVLNATATGLSQGFTYSLYVRSDCGAGDFSTWSSPLSVTLPCNAQTLPLYEGFNSTSLPCWTSVVVTDTDADFTGTSPGFYIQSSSINPPGLTPQEGSDFLVFNSYDCDSGDQIRLISPPLTTTGIPSVDVGFKWGRDNGFSTDNDRVRVFYSFTGGAPWTAAAPANSRYDAGAASPYWEQVNLTMPVAVANQPLVYIGLLFTSQYGNDCHLDDFYIIETITCFPPTALTVDEGGNFANLSWTAPTPLPLNGYEWEVRTAGAGGSGPVGLAASGSTAAGDLDAVATGLAFSTSYSLYVRAMCGVGDESTWAGPQPFTTLAVNPPSNNAPGGAINVPFSGNAYPSCSAISGNCALATNSSESTGTGPDLWYKFIAPTTAVRITLTSAGMDNAIEIFDNTLTPLVGGYEDAVNSVGGFERMGFLGLTIGQQYYVSVGAASGAGSTYSLCIQYLNPGNTDDGDGTYDMCTNFKADYTGANQYIFHFTPTSYFGPTTTATSPNQIALSSAGLNLQHGETYDVTVDAVYAIVDGNNISSNIVVVGTNVTSVTIANHADLRTKSTQICPSTVLKGTTLQAKPFICAAINHTITFKEVGDCNGADVGGIQFTSNTSGSSPTKSLAQVGGIQAGKWYEVFWTPNFVYGAGTPGTTDIIYVSGTAEGTLEPNLEAAYNANNESTLSIYPNPNAGEILNLNITDLNSDEVYVRILDAQGRQVFADRFMVDGSLNTMVTFNQPLAGGLYFVEMRSGELVITEKMMVQK